MLKVFAYRNLHRNCWSVKALEGALKGRVIYHAQDVTLWNCTFKVSEAGRQRVLRERSKNVHAGIVGMFDEDTAHWTPMKTGANVTYNPYKYDSFVFKDTEQKISNANFVKLWRDKHVTAYA
jgi:hypothetical protein